MKTEKIFLVLLLAGFSCLGAFAREYEEIAESWHKDGIKLAKEGRDSEALQCFDAAIKDFGSRDPIVFVRRGQIYLKQQKFFPAKCDFSSAIVRSNCRCAAAYLGHGMASYETGEYKQALSDYTTLIRLCPDESVGYALRAKVHYQLRNYDASRADLAKAAELIKARPKK